MQESHSDNHKLTADIRIIESDFVNANGIYNTSNQFIEISRDPNFEHSIVINPGYFLPMRLDPDAGPVYARDIISKHSSFHLGGCI